MEQLKGHWETIYEQKSPQEVSWTQEKPVHSLKFIHELNLPRTAAIIDVGGGDSKLVDYLLAEGYENLTVLDLSANAIERAKHRLGSEKAAKVTWIISDVLEFQPDHGFDLWHDRATFHFLTEPSAIQQYQQLVHKAVKGYMVMGTFSENGPSKCSGLSVSQYSAEQLTASFEPEFRKIRCEREEHHTPSGQPQEFMFCSFKTDQ